MKDPKTTLWGLVGGIALAVGGCLSEGRLDGKSIIAAVAIAILGWLTADSRVKEKETEKK